MGIYDPFIGHAKTIEEMENDVLGYVHLKDYETAFGILHQIINRVNYESGVNNEKSKIAQEDLAGRLQIIGFTEKEAKTLAKSYYSKKKGHKKHVAKM